MAERVLEKTEVTIGALVQRIADRSLLLPVMQRQYVWRSTRVRDLLDSLYRGYPSGAILIWTTGADEPTRQLSVAQSDHPISAPQLLLDGQQRLTSLAAVLRNEPLIVRGRRKPIQILFNLEHPESIEEVVEVDEDDPTETEDEIEASEGDDEESLPERLRRFTFIVGSKQLAEQPNWVSVSEVMTSANDGEVLKRAGVKSFDDPRYNKYNDRLNRLRNIRDYRYTVHVLGAELSYEEVTEIFVRVNSLGVKLRSSDLALAQISARWRDVLGELESFRDEGEKAGFTLELGMLVRAMVVFSSGQSRFLSLSNIPVDRLKAGWAKAKPALLFAMNFLGKNGRVEDESLLSSPFFLITLAYYYDTVRGEILDEDSKALLEWAFVGSGRAYYSGTTETKLDADLSRVRSGGGAQALLGNLIQMFGRKRFEAGDLVGRNAKSGLFSLVFLALRARGARDWRTNLEISLSSRGATHKIQWHHIFPKATLREAFDRKEINDISNLAFLSGETNRRIAATPASEYLARISEERGDGALVRQCIPMDRELWRLDRYPSFLEARRGLLALAVNEFLDKLGS